MKYKDLHTIKINGKVYSLNEKTSFANLPIDISDFLMEWINESEFITVQTSGSTGTPKKLKIKKQLLVNSAVSTVNYLKLKSHHNFLLALPCQFIGGKMMLVRAMVCQANVVLTSAKLSPHIPSNKIHFAAFTPIQVNNILEGNSNQLDKIDMVIIGGAPVNFKLEQRLKVLKNKIYETFGMTETISHIALRKIGHSHFKTLAPTVVSANPAGQLIINSKHLNIYKLITNDLVFIKNNQEFKWIGRKDFVINSGGLKIIPEQIEGVLEQHLDSSNFMVSKIAHETLGEQCIVLYQENEISPKKINNALAFVSSPKRPKKIMSVKKIYKTKSGKINRLKTIKQLQYG